jgi:hypothetical protein
MTLYVTTLQTTVESLAPLVTRNHGLKSGGDSLAAYKPSAEGLEHQRDKYSHHILHPWLQRCCSTAFVSMALVGSVIFSPIVPADSMAMMPPSSPQATVLEDATLPKPDTIGTMTEDQTSIEPIIFRQEEEEPLLDEVWSLVDKYYIDRSFAGQDWKKVKEKYTRLSSKARNIDSKFQLVKEMVASLNDKYSRILDPEVSADQFHYELTFFPTI